MAVEVKLSCLSCISQSLCRMIMFSVLLGIAQAWYNLRLAEAASETSRRTKRSQLAG